MRHVAHAQHATLNVRFGSLADICNARSNVRFTPESGHWAAPTCAPWKKSPTPDRRPSPPLGYIKVTSRFWGPRIFGNREVGVPWLHGNNTPVLLSSIFRAHL